MEKVLLGENWDHFGVMLDTDDIGIGVNLTYIRDDKGYLLTIDLLVIHIYIAIY